MGGTSTRAWNREAPPVGLLPIQRSPIYRPHLGQQYFSSKCLIVCL